MSCETSLVWVFSGLVPRFYPCAPSRSCLQYFGSGEFPLPGVLFILLSILYGKCESEILAPCAVLHLSDVRDSVLYVTIRTLSCLDGILVVPEKLDLSC